MSQPFENFKSNFGDIEKLLDIHSLLTGGIQGKNKDKTVVVLRSSIVLICACLEIFFEDMAIWGAKEICERDVDPKFLSKNMKKKIANKVKIDKNELAPLDLIGDGWKLIYSSIVRDMCDGQTGGFNSPNYKNVSSLIDYVFGIGDISECWSWGGMYPKLARGNLNKLVSLRGDIAHGKRVTGLSVQTIRTYANLASNIAKNSMEYVDGFLDGL